MAQYFPKGREYRYLGKTHEDNWTLATPIKSAPNLKQGQKPPKKKGPPKETFLPKLAWVASTKWVKVQGTKSPYDGDHPYWLRRLSNYGGTRTRKLMKRQKGFCTWCNTRFSADSRMEVDHVIARCLGGKDEYTNLQLLHAECHAEKTKQDLTKKRKVVVIKAKQSPQ